MFFNKITTMNFILKRAFSSSNLTKTEMLNGVKTITMCDQKTRNSLSKPMMENLIGHIKEDMQNYDLRVIIISAEGAVFSAGHNLKEIAEDRQEQEKCFKLASELMYTIIDSPVPVIAKVDGIAAAAGCQLVAQCDMVVCTDRSKFSTPGANFGIFCSTPGIALARCMHKMPALHMLFTGLPVSAVEAKSIGLVTQVCQAENLDEHVEVICDAIKSKSRAVIELGRKFYYKQIQCDVKKAYELGGETMVENLQMQDCKEGIRSFIEKRRPQWNTKG